MELNYLDLFKFYLFNSGSCSCMGGYGCVWGVLTCPHTHAHACTCKDMCNAKIYMYRHCKWPPPWRHPCLSCLTSMCVSPTHPHYQVLNKLRYLNSIWGFEICGHYPTCGWVDGWVDGWGHVISLTRKPYGFIQSSFLGHHDGSCHGLWWFVVIHVMLCAGFCHGSWWFMSWFVVICSDLWFVVIHVMVNLWWFVVICDDSCHHL